MKWSVVALVVLLAASVRAEAQVGQIEGTVSAERSNAPVAGATVRLAMRALEVTTDSTGRFVLRDVPQGRARVEVTAAGFRPYFAMVRVPRNATLRLDVEMTPRVQQLPTQSVQAPRDETEEESRTRELTERNVVPGATTLSRNEMRAMPALAEPDVLRSLQMLPGMIAVNDLDAQLYVRGGSADQNLFLLDGAPVFGAYHIFGMNGVFNSDAIESVDFFRGTRPPRFGGALSSVVAITQRAGDEDLTEVGVSLLGVRATQRGAVAGGRARWMLAGRRALADVFGGDELPLAFFDAQLRGDASVGGHDLGVSAFTSKDRFRMFFGGGNDELRSKWSNATGTLRWRSPAWRGWTTSSVAFHSAYDAELSVGQGALAPRTSDELRMSSVRVEVERGTVGAGFRAGAEVVRTRVSLMGAEEDGTFFFGTAARQYTAPNVHIEGDRMFGPIRLAPGFRIARDINGGTLLEPRLGVRAQLASWSLTLGASRDHQVLSGLRDERTVLPGPTLWFLHPAPAPPSRADALTGELTLWAGAGWNISLGGYARRFRDTPHWRPEGERSLSSLSFDDGQAHGMELGVRRFGRRVAGWLGYGNNTTWFMDRRTGERYASIADRRHAVNAAAMWRPRGRFTLSAQGAFGSGLPFWPLIGDASAPSFEPFDTFYRGVSTSRLMDTWADQQMRMPNYARIDVAARHQFVIGRVFVEPYLGVQNATARPNVVYYRTDSPPQVAPDGPIPVARPIVLRPIPAPWTILPTLGFDVRF